MLRCAASPFWVAGVVYKLLSICHATSISFLLCVIYAFGSFAYALVVNHVGSSIVSGSQWINLLSTSILFKLNITFLTFIYSLFFLLYMLSYTTFVMPRSITNPYWTLFLNFY